MHATACDHELNVVAFTFHAILPDANFLSEERKDSFVFTAQSHTTDVDLRIVTPPPRSA